MVISINYWLKAFGITDSENKPAELGIKLLDTRKGYDPYLEDLGSIWLLHYSLVSTNKASIYNIFFNEFRKGRIDFTKEQFLVFLKRLLEKNVHSGFNQNTIAADISVLIRNYLKPIYKEAKIDIEEDFASLMIDLDLISSYKSENSEGRIVDWYKTENLIRKELPIEIFLFSILNNPNYGRSISFKELLNGYNSPGAIFCLNDEGLYNQIQEAVKKYRGITYSESAGIREMQIKSTINKWDLLDDYYEN